MQKKILLYSLFLFSQLGASDSVGAYDPSKLNVTYSAMYAYVFKLLLIFGVIVAFLYVWRKFFYNAAGFQTNANLKVVEKLQLDLKSTLYLVELNGKFFLVGTGDKSPVLLDSFGESQPEVAYIQKKSFDDVLKNLKKKDN